jgi:hypothetical protein
MTWWTVALALGALTLAWMALAQWARAARPGNPVDFPFAYGRDAEKLVSSRHRRAKNLPAHPALPKRHDATRRRTIDYPYMDAKLVERPRRR